MQLVRSQSLVTIRSFSQTYRQHCQRRLWISSPLISPIPKNKLVCSRRHLAPIMSVSSLSSLAGSAAMDENEGAQAASMNQPRVKGKTVLITGGSQGVGRETAKLFARKGYNVVVVAREPTRLQAVADEVAAIRGRKETSLAVSADISDRGQVAELARRVRGQFESLDVLINNAGICASGGFLDTPLDVWDSMMGVNVMGAVNVSHALLVEVVKAKGSIVFVNSWGGVMPIPNMAAYVSSKHALAGFADSLALEMKQSGVHVGQVHPGVINSDFLERAQFFGKEADKVRQTTEEAMGSAVAVSPKEVADAVWKAFDKKEKEVIVGAVFSEAVGLYRRTGTVLI